MWYNGTVTAARKLRIAYNISLRRLFGIPKYNSASEMFVQLNNNSLVSTGDTGRQPPPLLPPLRAAISVDTIIHNYRLSTPP